MNLFSILFVMTHLKYFSKKSQNNIFLLDIDNTLLIPQNIYIYYEKDDIKIKYNPEEYAKLNVTTENKKYYDYCDFRDVNAIRNSIQTSLPLKHNLEIVDEFIKNGWNLGLLTARGQERLISRITPRWLKQYLKNKHPEIKRENVHAVNDEYKIYDGYTDPEKKLLVLKSYVESGKYGRVAFIDDNLYTINLIKKYNKSLPKDKKIILIYAK